MDNVLDITPHLPEKAPLDVTIPLQVVTRMLQVGAISRHAYGIGLLAIAYMQEDGEYACTLTRQEIARGAVMIEGEPAVALGNPEIHELAAALHALQFNCGIWNHILANRVGKGKEKYNHFTEPHRGDGSYEALYRIIKHDTPIHFCWLPERQDEIIEHARDVVEHKLMISRFSNIRTVKLP
jgi:hypothetical protein